ncbi:MAG TPA: PQQ-binding-like beta-propeller repeat protein [Gemmataceae bacterium]|nr:PQQ-binding-like beta-propeller repeat protein [Gemmataceae bacterium]
MQSSQSLRRIVILGATALILGGVLSRVHFESGSDRTSPNPLYAQEPERPISDMLRIWPMFGGHIGRNMVNLAEKGVPTEWEMRKNEQKKNLKWVAKLGSQAYGGPVIAAGKVFVGTNNGAPRNDRDRDPKSKKPFDKGVLMCFRESDGKFLWQHVNDKLRSGNENDFSNVGICSTPIVEDGRVYYVSNRCVVNCLDTEGLAHIPPAERKEQYTSDTDAHVIWQYDMMKELNVFPHNMSACSPLIVGDLLFVVTGNGVDDTHTNIPKPDAPSFIALNKKTGELVWKDSSPGRQILHGQWSNPTYAEIGGKPQVIFPGGDGWLRSFESQTGKLIWKCDCNPKDSVYDVRGSGTRSDFIATPVVHDGKVYIGLGQDPDHSTGISHLWCIDPAGKTGDISPELVTDATMKPPKTAKNPNSGIVWHYGGLDPDPKAKREFIFGRTMSTLSVHDGLLYAAELDGFLHCLDAKTGELYWRHDLKSTIWGSTYWVDGKIYLATESGDVYVFAHGKEKKLINKVEMEEPIRSTPVVSNGVLYVMSELNLYAIQEKK